ncbi:geranylgeranyl transferase type-2 subunit alpha 1 [Malania oleifera]|uniref:geranylgeranyl transferase type-2 subunit alpha 1 n=1 Tax=Malania oleifera TaxID=397392 RepID=UPI0025ADD418|nr:geranylgeranyl transferase type-2 subunit alpha 1 [Malania oleifera]
MHGRPRKASKPEDAEASAAKTSNLRSLQSQLLHYHHDHIYTKDAVDVSAKLLEINPEWQTAWNYRKLAVEHMLKQSESDPDSIKSILDVELKVVESALRQNFKSYGPWHHRKWVLNKGHASIDRELRLLDQFQKADSRNFHAWAYRRFVAAMKKIPHEEELKFTTEMVNTNFSNYSAWHNRSILLSQLLDKGVQGFVPKEKVLIEEYELVHQALFTDPDDQSGWFYHLWLLDQTVKTETPLLVSSWPAHHSDLTVSVDGSLDGSLSPFAIVNSHYGTFPLILYFSQAVKGVNSSTVTVESVFNVKEDLIWRPISATSCGAAKGWVTQLNISDHSSKAYPVEVSVGHLQGIISSSGAHYTHPSRFSFTVCVQPHDAKHAEGQGEEMILWRDENFHICETCSQESGLITSFGQTQIYQEHEPSAPKWQAETIANETALFRELLSVINCKIGMLSLARLLTAHDVMMSFNTTPFSYKTGHSKEILELFSELMKLDPSHSRYYKDEHSLVLLRQVSSDREYLLRHCFHYRNSSSPSIGSFICLRLNNLSLTRIGSVEQLLWVQMLDLSHNELQSIEGLEAMQRLTCLNLSNNRISSFLALEPLKLLKSLEVLDISYNEIGAHSIDTRRYLCPSPLSHTVGDDWKLDEKNATSGVDMANYWEALLIFKGMNLKQLDIMGNAIPHGNFKSFVAKILPKLKWLNGQNLY